MKTKQHFLLTPPLQENKTWVFDPKKTSVLFGKDLYSVLEKQDLTYMPPEVKGWMDAMHMLSRGFKWIDGFYGGGGVGQPSETPLGKTYPPLEK